MKTIIVLAVLALAACDVEQDPRVEVQRDTFETRSEVQRMCCSWNHRNELVCSGVLGGTQPTPVTYVCDAKACMWVGQ